MFEAIGTLITIVIWAAAIFLFVFGIIACIANLKDGTGGEKFLALIALVIGILAFAFVYSWCESIVWCMIASGLVFCTIGNALSDPGPKSKPEPQPGPTLGDFGRALGEAYVEQELRKEAVREVINEPKKW